jgi:hypothetical protein
VPRRTCSINLIDGDLRRPLNWPLQSRTINVLGIATLEEETMFRVKIIVIIFGVAAIFWGGSEFYVSSGTSSEPVAVELTDLESDPTPPNNHIEIGEHLAVYPGGVYAYRGSKYGSDTPGPATKISYFYYPIISYDNSFVAEMAALVEKYDTAEAIPESEPEPPITDIPVLVKTERFDTIGKIPMTIDAKDSIKGLVVNRIDSLDSEEEKLLKESFPQVDMRKVLILEENRKPASFFKSLGLIAVGLLFLVGGGVWIFEGTRSG